MCIELYPWNGVGEMDRLNLDLNFFWGRVYYYGLNQGFLFTVQSYNTFTSANGFFPVSCLKEDSIIISTLLQSYNTLYACAVYLNERNVTLKVVGGIWLLLSSCLAYQILRPQTFEFLILSPSPAYKPAVDLWSNTNAMEIPSSYSSSIVLNLSNIFV